MMINITGMIALKNASFAKTMENGVMIKTPVSTTQSHLKASAVQLAKMAVENTQEAQEQI